MRNRRHGSVAEGSANVIDIQVTAKNFLVNDISHGTFCLAGAGMEIRPNLANGLLARLDKQHGHHTVHAALELAVVLFQIDLILYFDICSHTPCGERAGGGKLYKTAAKKPLRPSQAAAGAKHNHMKT